MKKRRANVDPMLAMINVVFLLIAFFLFGKLEKPAPKSIKVPNSISGINSGNLEHIYIDKDGLIYFQNETGDDALTKLDTYNSQILLSADRDLKVDNLLSIWVKIISMGVEIQGIEVSEK